MNYYEILGVTPESDLAEIKSAYRKLVRKYHPDVNLQGAKKFKDISKAYEVLSDEDKRKNYDILNGLFKSADTKLEDEDLVEDTPVEETVKENKSKKFEDYFSFLKINFKEKIKKAQSIAQNGENINADVTITLDEAINGTTKVINVVHSELCPRCKGRKFINGTKCSVCGGSGEYSQYKRISVVIPPNIKDGTKLRLKNEGHTGKFGGKNGDLYLFVNIKNQNNFQYEGLDIHYNLAISPFDAVLGTNANILGNLKLKIPPKTTSGQKFRLSGQGLKKNGNVGDMIVTVAIEISKDLSDDEIKMYEKLKKMSK